MRAIANAKITGLEDFGHKRGSGGAKRIHENMRTLKQKLVRDLGDGRVTVYEALNHAHMPSAFKLQMART